jgi:hypothetical protein
MNERSFSQVGAFVLYNLQLLIRYTHVDAALHVNSFGRSFRTLRRRSAKFFVQAVEIVLKVPFDILDLWCLRQDFMNDPNGLRLDASLAKSKQNGNYPLTVGMRFRHNLP